MLDMEYTGVALPWKLTELKVDTKLSATLGLDLLEAVSFIHSKGVAHLDIKPANVTVRQDQLYIIDFNSSRPAPNPTATYDRFVGTEKCVPHEIEIIPVDGVGPPFSMIRADLWECGKVLDEIVGSKQTRRPSNATGVEEALSDLRSYATDLLSDDPTRRTMPSKQALQRLKTLLVNPPVSGNITATSVTISSASMSPPVTRQKSGLSGRGRSKKANLAVRRTLSIRYV